MTTHLKRARAHHAEWESLRERYLPVAARSGSIWRFSRFRNQDDAEQGWKLHISASILSANKTLKRVASYLNQANVLFKAPDSLEELLKLNSGMFYGYSQVGKFITVYPRNPDEAVTLATELDRLTHDLSGPVVPFDSRFGPRSNIYYRYGSFELQMPDGRTPAIRNTEGCLVEDSYNKPEWVDELFTQPQIKSSDAGLASTPFRAVSALSQRGKGGVYQGLDFRFNPPRPCIIKQGRSGGELSWARKDGAWMVRNEAKTLATLARAGIEVPAVYAKFKLQQNQYVVLEYIKGESLQTFLEKQEKRLPIRRVVELAKQISAMITQIHRAGWLWLDCKPANLILTPNGKLRPLDFEGACPSKRPVSLTWQTPAYMAPQVANADQPVSTAEDVYALGVTCYYLLTGHFPDRSKKTHKPTLGRRVPPQFRELIEKLLNPDPHSRPSIDEVNVRLASCCAAVQTKGLVNRGYRQVVTLHEFHEARIGLQLLK